MATRNRISLAGAGGSALLDSLDAFKRKHVSQNKEIIHRNSELMRLNAELSKQVRDLQQEAIELRADNARSSSAHANTYQQLQECLAEVDRLRMCQSQAEQLRQALHLITQTAEHAVSLLPPDSQSSQQQQQPKRNRGHLTSDNGSSRPTTACSYTDSMPSDPDGDTILPTSASLRANHIDNREPLISSKPDLSLIDEASQEESFHRQQLLQSSSSRGHHQWSDIADPPALLPPSVAVTRPRRSSSAASLRPSLDEVYEESERSPSTSPAGSPVQPLDLNSASKEGAEHIFPARPRTLDFATSAGASLSMVPPPAVTSAPASSSDRISNSVAQTPSLPSLESDVERLAITAESEKPDVLPKRRRTASQPANDASSSAASSTVSSRARSRAGSVGPFKSGSQQNLRGEIPKEDISAQSNSSNDPGPTLAVRRRRSSSSLAATNSSSTQSAAPPPRPGLNVRSRSGESATSSSASSTATRASLSNQKEREAESARALDKLSNMSKRASASSSTSQKRGESRERSSSSSIKREEQMLLDASPMDEDDLQESPASTPPPEVDVDGLVVKKRRTAHTPGHNDMQPLQEELEPQSRRSTSSLSNSSSSLKQAIEAAHQQPQALDDADEDGAGAGSRRARKSVNYALPNLRDKMRKPEGSGSSTKRSVSGSRHSASYKHAAGDEEPLSEPRGVLGDASNNITLPRRKSSAALSSTSSAGGGANKEDTQPATSTTSSNRRHQRLASS